MKHHVRRSGVVVGTGLLRPGATPIGRRPAFDRCRSALEALGLAISPALEEARRAIADVPSPAPLGRHVGAIDAAPYHLRTEERRLVTVLFAQLVGVSVPREGRDPEDVKQVVGNALAGTIAEVEGLGGTVTSVSGAGLAAVFGAPEAHEDDPERAVRAGFRMMSVMAASGTAAEPEPLSVRVGIESGTAIVGPLWSAGGSGYGAAGAVVETAAVLQWAAKPGSVLVGPATRIALKAF